MTTTYKKTDPKTTRDINREAKNIATKLDLADRIECIADKPAFITLKDHKDNFENNPKCRLINPAKSEIGVISKHKLQEINQIVREHTNLRQWRNTSTVLSWFKDIRRKKESRFVQLDIVDFYPSISEELLIKSLDYAQTITTIDAATREIIMHSRKSLLFSEGCPWIKKTDHCLMSLWDHMMGLKYVNL